MKNRWSFKTLAAAEAFIAGIECSGAKDVRVDFSVDEAGYQMVYGKFVVDVLVDDEPCKHEPDWSTVSWDASWKRENPADNSVIDVTCKHCGLSGSVHVPAAAIQWE